MRLLIIGTLEGQIGAASQIAIRRGARVEQVDTTDAGLRALRRGQGADLAMIDVMLDIGKFIKSLELERISLPVVAGGGRTQPAGDGEDGTTAALVGRTVADVERELIIDTLQHCLGNRTHAANILGISIRTLRNKLKRYGERGFAVPTPGEAERPAA